MRSNQLNYVPEEKPSLKSISGGQGAEHLLAIEFTLPRAALVGGIRFERMTFCL